MKRRKRKRPSGQGTIWERGGNFWVQWREGGRRQSAKFPTEDTARRETQREIRVESTIDIDLLKLSELPLRL